MAMKIPVMIDGILVQVDEGTSILAAARLAGTIIPTLCFHEALVPYGACRLCTVEIVQNRKRRLVTSCNVPAEQGMEVFTDTARVRQIRKMLVELLLVRCPDIPAIQRMARRMGIETTMLRKRDDKHCILCGLCVRFCEEVVGASAIGLSNRGTEREVTTPFRASSESCIGCGSCTYICPTGCIEMVSDRSNPSSRYLRMGLLSRAYCPHDQRCEACDTDHTFIEDMKGAIREFRGKFNKEG